MDPNEMLEAAQNAYDRGDYQEARSFLYNCATWRNMGGYEPEGWHDRAVALWKSVEAAFNTPVAPALAA